MIVQSPNFLGTSSRRDEVANSPTRQEAIRFRSFNPLSLGCSNSPGEMDVDIAIGEGQPLGIPAAVWRPVPRAVRRAREFMRKMPGRLVGQTVDADGKRALLPDAANPRAAHPPRESDEQRLHESGPAGPAGQRLSGAMGPAGLREAAQLCFTTRPRIWPDQLAARRGIERRYPECSRFSTRCLSSSIGPSRQCWMMHRSGDPGGIRDRPGLSGIGRLPADRRHRESEPRGNRSIG